MSGYLRHGLCVCLGLLVGRFFNIIAVYDGFLLRKVFVFAFFQYGEGFFVIIKVFFESVPHSENRQSSIGILSVKLFCRLREGKLRFIKKVVIGD